MRQAATKHTDPWAALDAEIANNVEPTGPEWITVAQYQAKHGKCYAWANHRLNDLHRAGRAEKWTGARKGRPGMITKYRPTP